MRWQRTTYTALLCSIMLCGCTSSQKSQETTYESMTKLANAAKPFMSSEDQSKLNQAMRQNQDRLVRYAMQDLEQAVVQYSAEHGGQYPAAIDDRMNNWLIKVMNRNTEIPVQYIPGKGIVNPFTNQPEWPKTGTISDVTAVRKAEPQPMRPGEIQYNSINGTSFAIIGGGANGKALEETLFKPQGFRTKVLSDVFNP